MKAGAAAPISLPRSSRSSDPLAPCGLNPAPATFTRGGPPTLAQRTRLPRKETRMELPRSRAVPAVTAADRPVGRLLAGQKALVTGASSGIGRAIALALGAAGADVVVNYAGGVERAEEVAAAIRHNGGKAYAQQADVAQEAEVEAMFRRMLGEFGTIDILVNNAGLQRDAAFHEMTLAEWNTVIGVNLTARGKRSASFAAAASFRRFRARPARSSASARSTSSFRGPATPTTPPPKAASC